MFKKVFNFFTFYFNLIRVSGSGINPVNGNFVFIKQAIFLLIFFAGSVYSWPTTDQWIPIYRDGSFIQDENGDTNGPRNVVSDNNNAATFLFNDGIYFYVRIRLDEDPTGSGGQKLLKSFGWGIEFDTNLRSTDYEWLLMVDGIGAEGIDLRQNTVQGNINDPGDKTEVLAESISLAGNFQVNLANTSFNGNTDYFLDWRFPFASLKTYTGLNENSPIRLIPGSSSSTNALTENGADLVGPSDLSSAFSDVITFYGTRPETGVVKFAQNIAGNGDVEFAVTGDILYISVTDSDQNYDFTVKQQVVVTITTAVGDSETITLNETADNTGVFTSSIPSASAIYSAGDGVLQGVPGEFVTVSYTDAIDDSYQSNQLRTDTLQFYGPEIQIAKDVTPDDIAAGGAVTYTITITNSGQGDAWIRGVEDSLPTGFSYITDSTTGFTTNNPSISNQNILSWTGNWVVPAKQGNTNGSLTLTFQAAGASVTGSYFNIASVSGANFSITSTGQTAQVDITAPLLALQKDVSKTQAQPGDEVIYTITFRNTGDGQAKDIIIFDTVPLFTTFISGTLRIGDITGDYDSATSLTDAEDGIEGTVNGTSVEASITGMSIKFVIHGVPPNDGNQNSGNDEGKVYFKVKVND